MSRTAIMLDTALVDELAALTDAPSKTEAVRRAVAEQVRRARLRRIRASVGQLEFEDAEELRHDDHRIG